MRRMASPTRSSPMRHAIFFHEGFAIHGSYETSRLGRAASHGCVRLHPEHAAVLFSLVQKEGTTNTEIVVTGANPVGRPSGPSRRQFYFYRSFSGRI